MPLICENENLSFLAKDILSKLVSRPKAKMGSEAISKTGKKGRKSVNRFRRTAHDENKRGKEVNLKKQKIFRIKTVDLIKKKTKAKRYYFKKSNENIRNHNMRNLDYKEEEEEEEEEE